VEYGDKKTIENRESGEGKGEFTTRKGRGTRPNLGEMRFGLGEGEASGN